MELQTIQISDGRWSTGGYHWRIQSAYFPSSYTIIPLDGAPALSDGRHKGFIVRDGILRIVYGGEYYSGFTINHQFFDYKVDLIEDECNEYETGLLRGYHGKRAASEAYRWRQSSTWRKGYAEGRRVKMEELKAVQSTELATA